MLKHKFFISPDLFLYEGIFELPLKIAGEEGNYISAVNDGKFQCTLCDGWLSKFRVGKIWIEKFPQKTCFFVDIFSCLYFSI